MEIASLWCVVGSVYPYKRRIKFHCHFLALLGAHHIPPFSRMRVKGVGVGVNNVKTTQSYVTFQVNMAVTVTLSSVM